MTELLYNSEPLTIAASVFGVSNVIAWRSTLTPPGGGLLELKLLNPS